MIVANKTKQCLTHLSRPTNLAKRELQIVFQAQIPVSSLMESLFGETSTSRKNRTVTGTLNAKHLMLTVLHEVTLSLRVFASWASHKAWLRCFEIYMRTIVETFRGKNEALCTVQEHWEAEAFLCDKQVEATSVWQWCDDDKWSNLHATMMWWCGYL